MWEALSNPTLCFNSDNYAQCEAARRQSEVIFGALSLMPSCQFIEWFGETQEGGQMPQTTTLLSHYPSAEHFVSMLSKATPDSFHFGGVPNLGINV